MTERAERDSPVMDMLVLMVGVESLVTVATKDVVVAVTTPPPSPVEVGMAGSDDVVVFDWLDNAAVNPRALVQ